MIVKGTCSVIQTDCEIFFGTHGVVVTHSILNILNIIFTVSLSATTISRQMIIFQMHIVHYSSMYDSTTEAADRNDGLAVLGFFFKVYLSSDPCFNTIKYASEIEINEF